MMPSVPAQAQQTSTNLTALFTLIPNDAQSPSSPLAIGAFGFSTLFTSLPNTQTNPENPLAPGAFGFLPLFPGQFSSQGASSGSTIQNLQSIGGAGTSGTSLQGGGGVSLGGDVSEELGGAFYVALLIMVGIILTTASRYRG